MKRKNIVDKIIPYVATGAIFLLLAIVMIALSHGLPATATVGREQAMSAGSQHTGVPQPTPTSVPTPAETPYPKPTYIPTLRFYDIDKSHDIWHAKDPSSYITPNNEWVRYYASQLYVDTDGWVKYKNEKVPYLMDVRGNILSWTNKSFINNYTFDIYREAYGYVDENNVPWLMPDFYLANGHRGVCSGWALAVTSMMLSGEMSTKDYNGNLVKQVIPAKSVMGYVGSAAGRDVWVEYQAYGKSWITSTGLDKEPYNGNRTSTTSFIIKDSQFRGVFEFTDKYFKEV